MAEAVTVRGAVTELVVYGGVLDSISNLEPRTSIHGSRDELEALKQVAAQNFHQVLIVQPPRPLANILAQISWRGQVQV